MSVRITSQQRTLSQPAELSGFGMFSGHDVRLKFLPAPIDHGIAFQRIDLPDAAPIPATIDHLVPSHRRTVIGDDAVQVEMIEHVMAALAGLQIDNCLIEIDGAEVPGFDGSALPICEALLAAGLVELDAPRRTCAIRSLIHVRSTDGRSEIQVRPHIRRLGAVTYHLDYGDRSPVPPQLFSTELTPQRFLNDIAYARTFVLESEVEALRAAGYGQRMTAQDLLVFCEDGSLIDNQLRAPNECVRHKLLDCIGDFALLGCDIYGHFSAWRSGHALNHQTVSRLQREAFDESRPVLGAA